MSVKLFRYIDKATQEERGVCYSDKNGNSAINNPDWDSIEIIESEKQMYIDKHNAEINARKQAMIKTSKEQALEALGLTQKDLDNVKALRAK